VIKSLISLLTSKSFYPDSLLKNFLKFYYPLTIYIIIILLSGCAASKRYGEEKIEATEEIEYTERFPGLKEEIAPTLDKIRVLLEQTPSASFMTLQNRVSLHDDKSKIAVVSQGNTLEFYDAGNLLNLRIGDKNFSGNFFKIEPDEGGYVSFNQKRYKGNLTVFPSENSVRLINNISIEDYLKGVISKEMPVGKGNENYEALKALTICARTYALIRIKEGKTLFDLFPDTRDQVYGGVDAEHPLTSKAVDETKNIILSYKGEPALLYYHSTCGGHTESAHNVFTDEKIEYLKGIQDGNPANCSISPRYNWTEVFSGELIIQRLKKAALISHTNYSLEDMKILSRFDSGRVNELRFVLKDINDDKKTISVFGNDIRQVLQNADGKLILWSNMFDIEKNGDEYILIGKGFGHGVGLCQWGAIELSKNGRSFEEILQHYFPGTSIGFINDQN
jgi:stage II sporulation protein D